MIHSTKTVRFKIYTRTNRNKIYSYFDYGLYYKRLIVNNHNYLENISLNKPSNCFATLNVILFISNKNQNDLGHTCKKDQSQKNLAY